MVVIPNIRSTIIPDPGYVLVEPDLRQADAQVVAWESNEETMKSLFRRNIDIYTETETRVWIDPKLPQSRQTRKNCVHSVDYGSGKRTLAERYVGSTQAAEDFIVAWFRAHPGIRQWQRRVEWDMQQGRTPIIYNVFGYRRVYACATPITQPLAWIGQSTISIVNKKMLLALDAMDIWLLAPNHDSVLMQVPAREWPSCAPAIIEACSIPIPYSDPLTIPVELKYSERDWGHMEKWQ
jgi:DNA polymerase family A